MTVGLSPTHVGPFRIQLSRRHDIGDPGGEVAVVVGPGGHEQVQLAQDADFELRLAAATSWRGRTARLLVLTDLAAVGGGVLAAYLGRIVAAGDFMNVGVDYALLTGALVVAWMAALASARAYEARLFGVGTEEFRRLVVASFAVFGALAIISFVLKFTVARGFVAIALPVGLLLLVIERFAVRKWVQRSRMSGRLQHRVIVIGNHTAAEALANQIRSEPFAGFTVVGACLPVGDSADPGVKLSVLGSFDEVVTAVRSSGADTVAVSSSPEISADVLKRLAWDLEGSGVDLVVAPMVTDVAGPRISIRPVAGLPLLYVDEPVFTGPSRVVKRGIDLVGSGLGLLVLSPVLLAIALWIRATSSGPALFHQTRIGRDGEEFQVVKFRTMYQDAEARKAGLVNANETDGLLFKITDDPRITRPGRVLRRASIDELPQLINVFKGEMSLVGPRPLPVDDSDFEGHVRRRLLVRPGITGLWQVSGRSDISWDEAVRLDLYYVENWSLALDVTILMRTVLAVWRGEGAY